MHADEICIVHVSNLGWLSAGGRAVHAWDLPVLSDDYLLIDGSSGYAVHA